MKRILVLSAAAFIFMAGQVCAADNPAPAPAPAAAAGAPAAPAAPAKPALPPVADKVGDAVPVWTANTIGEKPETFSSEKFKGGSYGLVFVNSSCAACRKEMDAIKNYKFKDNFTLLVAAVDGRPEVARTVYQQIIGESFPILNDASFSLAKNFGISFTPATVVVNNGKVEAWFAGYGSRSEDNILKALGSYGK